MTDYTRTQYANGISNAVTPDNIVEILSVLGIIVGVVSFGFMGCGYSFAYTNATTSFYLGPR